MEFASNSVFLVINLFSDYWVWLKNVLKVVYENAHIKGEPVFKELKECFYLYNFNCWKTFDKKN